MKPRGRVTLWITLYAAVVACTAFLASYRALVVQDGDALFDQTRSFWERGSFEIPNGLDVRDTLDLVLRQTTKTVPRHMYGKYPPLYSVVAALPVHLLGIRGMYLMNAIALAVVIVLYYALAARVLPRRLAIGSTIALPFVVPLFPYALMELPHLVSAAFVLLAIYLFLAAVRADARSKAFGFALASGLAAGFALGVRLQNITLCAVLAGLSLLRARRTLLAVAGQLTGQAACMVSMGLLNRERFGAFIPFSYGSNPLGGNINTESARYYLATPVVPLAVAYVVCVVFILRRTPLATRRGRAAMWVGLAGALAFGPLRHELIRMFRASCVMLVASTAFVHEPPSTTFGWFNKSLLAAAPALAIAGFGVVRVAWRRPSVEIEAAASVCFALVLFLSLRDPDPASGESVVGFLSISPRFLVDLFPLLLLLACWTVRDVRFAREFWLAGVAFAIPLAVIFIHTRDDTDPTRGFVVLSLSLGVAGLVAAAHLGRLFWPATGLMPAALGAAVAYGCVSSTLGDADALRQMGRIDDLWSRRVEAATPERFLLVGWDNAKDCIYPIREHRDAVFANAAVDDQQQLLATLDAFGASGRPMYYFGIGMEHVRPLVEERYAIIPVLADPLLWKFQRRTTGAGR